MTGVEVGIEVMVVMTHHYCRWQYICGDHVIRTFRNPKQDKHGEEGLSVPYFIHVHDKQNET